MKLIHKTIIVPISKELAFDLFISRLTNWWPKEYTWSQQKLVDIHIEPYVDGLCTEIGPHGFRCDWGRITSIQESKMVRLKWQISPQRSPVPDPDQASDLTIHFKESPEGTIIDLEHANFDLHGEGYEYYAKGMNSYKGWSYILDCFKKFIALQNV